MEDYVKLIGRVNSRKPYELTPRGVSYMKRAWANSNVTIKNIMERLGVHDMKVIYRLARELNLGKKRFKQDAKKLVVRIPPEPLPPGMKELWPEGVRFEDDPRTVTNRNGGRDVKKTR